MASIRDLITGVSQSSYPRAVYSPKPSSAGPNRSNQITTHAHCTSTSNRFLKGPTVILSGCNIQPKPRPLPNVAPQVLIPDQPVSEPDDPSGMSELLNGGAPNKDPYVSFFDDIQGWDEQAGTDLVSQLLDTKASASLKYISLDGMASSPDETQRKHLRRRKSKTKGKKAKPLKYSSIAGYGAEEDALLLANDNLDIEDEEEYALSHCDSIELNEAMVQKCALSNHPSPPNNTPDKARFQRNSSSAKYSFREGQGQRQPSQTNLDYGSKPSTREGQTRQYSPPNLDYITAIATDRVATLRKRLINSATSARTSWVGGINQPLDLGMTILTGKKYQGASPAPERTYRSRPHTASTVIDRTSLIQFSDDRMILPIISSCCPLENLLVPMVSKFTNPEKIKELNRRTSKNTASVLKKELKKIYAPADFELDESCPFDEKYDVFKGTPSLNNVIDWVEVKAPSRAPNPVKYVTRPLTRG